jgi:integrase/recombinase XerD
MERLLEALSHFEEGAGDFNHLVCRYRTHLVAELMYASGLRISEVAEVKEEELDLERGVIEVPCGKGGKRRTVFLNTYTASLLRIYVGEVRPLPRRAYHKAGTLFGSGGQRLLATTNALLKEKAAELKLPPLKSHGFRHALGTHLLRAGCDLRYIQAILGHLDIQSTEIYTKVEREDLVAILAKYHPRQLRRESIKA